MYSVKKINLSIDKLLKKNNTLYQPYNFSLLEKLRIASEFKDIINNNIVFDKNDFPNISLADLEKLKQTGIVQFSKPFLNYNQLTDIHNFLKSQKAFPAHIPYYDKYHPIRDPFNFNGKILSFNAKTIIETPHVIELLASNKILELVSNYLGTTPTLFDLNIIFSFGDVDIYHETQHFHRDHDDFHHCLLMIYLNDVDMESGGHIYAQASHKTNNLSAKISPQVKDNNSVSDLYDKRDNFVMETVIGAKGTGFISDANGLHAGSVPKLGKRRMIFWARYGLGENYMWEHHNHRYWGYDPKLMLRKSLNKSFNTNYIFRLFTEEYNHTKAREYKTRGDGCMKKTIKCGWNIGVYGKNYFAMTKQAGDIRIEKLVNADDNLKVAKEKVSHLNILVHDDEQLLIKIIQKKHAYPQPELIIKNFLYHNIIGYNCMFYGVLETDDSVNVKKINHEKVIKSKSLTFLKMKIKIKNFIYLIFSKDLFLKPVLIDDVDKHYNIIGFRNKFIAIKKSAGQVDFEDILGNPSLYVGKSIQSGSLRFLKRKILLSNSDD